MTGFCSQCEKTMEKGEGELVGPAEELWCDACLDNYDGPEPDLDAPNEAERAEVLARQIRRDTC